MSRRITKIETAIDKAFAELNEHSIKTGTPKTMDYNCCQTCSWSNFDSPEDKNVLFYHIQDLEGLRSTRRYNKFNDGYNEELEEECLYLSWYVDSNEILEDTIFPIFKKHNIKVMYDGTTKTRLRVSLMDLVDQVQDKDNVEICKEV